MSAFESIGPKVTGRLIGAILIESGRLRPEDVERVLEVQRTQGLRFGEAAIALGLATIADVEFALAQQFGYRCLVHGESKVSTSLLAAYTASGPEVEALRAIRGQLMQRWFNGDPARKALAVVSPARNEGRSFVAASLAVVFSRLGQRTLLIDADMRHPTQHILFGVDGRMGLSGVLAGRAWHESIQPIPSLPELSVLPAGAAPPNPQELLARPPFARLLHDVAQNYDVMLIDTPCAADCTDGHTAAVRAGAALIVARKNFSGALPTSAVCDALTQAGAAVVGTVLNDF